MSSRRGRLAMAGALVALGAGPGSGPPGAGPAGGGPGRPVAASAVLAPATPAGPEAGPPADVPAAAVDQGASAVPSFRPLELVFPDGSTAPVRPAGVRPDGSLVIPNDPDAVSWWDGGARPGEPFGSVVVAGHVDSARYGLGALARLKALRAGDVIELHGERTADGVTGGADRLRYRIGTRTRIAQADLAVRGDIFRQDVAARLVLITCGGAFDPVRRHYRNNLVVFADPLG